MSKEINTVLVQFRINCDTAWGEYKDNFYSEDEYKASIKRILDSSRAQLLKLLLESMPEKKVQLSYFEAVKNIRLTEIAHFNAGFNQAIKEYETKLRELFE